MHELEYLSSNNTYCEGPIVTVTIVLFQLESTPSHHHILLAKLIIFK